MRILVSNDDGVHADGMRILVDTIKPLGHVDVFAPDRNRSGASNSLTIKDPLHIRRLDNHFVSVEGTPTDCVHLALTGLLQQQPDWVVSGINEGANLGEDVWYSGTIAAAIEGRLCGVPGLALSLAGERCEHFQTAANVALQLLQHPPALTSDQPCVLNVNVPDLPYDQLKGWMLTRLGTRHLAEPTINQVDPRGRQIYWIGLPGKEADAGEGTDFYAVAQGYVSVTPLRVDITDTARFGELHDWLQSIPA